MLKVIGCLIVILVSVVATLGIALLALLNSLFVLTAETAVAEVVMSPIQSDANGEYIDIEFSPYLRRSAASEIINQRDEEQAPTLGKPRRYRVYGDTVGIEGPFIKLHDVLVFLHFRNVYKLSLIEGEYRQPHNANAGEGSEIEIDGGYDASWWDFNSQVAQGLYNPVVDRFTFASALEPGFYGTGKRRYEIVATYDTLTWNLIANITE